MKTLKAYIVVELDFEEGATQEETSAVLDHAVRDFESNNNNLSAEIVHEVAEEIEG